MLSKSYDIVIIGLGPAGFSAAYSLRSSALKILVIDKANFPRDKICGDALSADVVNQLQRIDPTLLFTFQRFESKKKSGGVTFFAPNGKELAIDYRNTKDSDGAAGYISKRMEFDFFLFNKLQATENIDVLSGTEVIDIEEKDSSLEIISFAGTFEAKMVLGADGAHSIVNKKLGDIKVEKEHYCAGIRQYFEGVNGFNSNSHIELHFCKDVLPGYLWIFPLPNGQANVGVGMLSSALSSKKYDLKKQMDYLIKHHPNLKDRFKNATPLENKKGYGLPIGSKKRRISGNRFLLMGDAASLIDPFTGEGIGNAIRSGRIAAEHILSNFENTNLDRKTNLAYDKIVYEKMWKELKVSRSLQKLLRYPALFNFVVNKAKKNESVRLLLTSMLDQIDLKTELMKPSFYLKLLKS